MGLDMYAFATREGQESIELAYWRKHNALHGWMEKLYRERGGTEVFNLIPLPLSLDDLDRLEADVKARTLEPVPGFFFGSTEYREAEWLETKRQDLAFIAKAREYISEGYAVVYDSFW